MQKKRKKKRNMLRRSAAAMLLLLIALFMVSSCQHDIELVYVGKDRVIQKLENGNWEVTEELVILYRKYKNFWDENHTP